MIEWLYIDHGKKRGPVTGEDLKSLAGQGAVIPSTPIRRVDGVNVSPWRRAGELKGLFKADVSTQLGDPICGICGERLAPSGACPACSPAETPVYAAPTPPPPPAPILTAEPITVAQPVAAFIEPPEEPTEIPFWRRRLELSPAPTGANEVVIVGVRLPLGDMMNLIITFWVASILISVVLGFIAFTFITVVGGLLR